MRKKEIWTKIKFDIGQEVYVIFEGCVSKDEPRNLYRLFHNTIQYIKIVKVNNKRVAKYSVGFNRLFEEKDIFSTKENALKVLNSRNKKYNKEQILKETKKVKILK